MERVGDLEINQDVVFQEREWNAERVGWGLLTLLILIAVAGLFGNGPLSWTSATSDDGLEIIYERFGRRGGSQELTVRAPATAASGGVWEIEVTRGYLASLEITAVSPEPDKVETIEGALRYSFTQATPGADLEVVFAVTPRHLLSQDGEFRFRDGEPVHVSQFFFP